ncbi:MAG: patatin-like phospholipase family protein [Alcanivoracaceae bacterium]|nr:patatin-like phospholipase family protein [Alcanivoracaceae bacterium]
MITVKQAVDPVKSNLKTGLALAGGGPLGGFYELGALCALKDCVHSLNLNNLDVYVGVSSGSFLVSALANGITTEEIADIFAFNKKTETPFNPDHFLRPAYQLFFQKAADIPLVAYEALALWLKNPLHTSIVDILEKIGSLLPNGAFNNTSLEKFIREVLNTKHASNDFRKLSRKLYIVACDINTGKIATFSTDENSDVPISKAVQASSALPGLYAPVNIKGKFYVDGALRRTMNASAALNQDVQLLFAVNPIVPFEKKHVSHEKSELLKAGLPMILSQTFRSIVQSRLKSGLAKYTTQYPKADIILIEPNNDDEMLFNTNLFSYSQRDKLCEYAYQQTRIQIQEKFDDIQKVLKRHNFSLNTLNLYNKERTLMDFLKQEKIGSSRVKRRLDETLNKLERAISH